MKNLFTFIILCVFTQQLAAQECGTVYEPMPEQLRKKMMQLSYAPPASIANRIAAAQVPLKIHIIRNDAGNGGLDASTLGESIEMLNNIFWSSDIEFFICGNVHYIDNSDYFDLQKDDYPELDDEYHVDNVLNVYVPNNIYSDDDETLAGFALFPWHSRHLIVVDKDYMDKSTLAHEIGHFLGLYHTHETANGAEYVNGNNCSTTGDYLCDTPADPNLSGQVSTFCEYTGNDTDPLGQHYNPDTDNIMSYSRKACRDNFSFGQSNRLQYYLQNYFSNYMCNQGNQDVELTLYAPITVTPSIIQCDESFSVHTNIWNTSTSTYFGDYTAALFDDNSDFVDYVEIITDSDGLPSNYIYTNGLTFEYDGPTLLPGNYTIGIFGLPENTNEWIPLLDGSYENFIDVYISCGGITATEEGMLSSVSARCFPNPASEVAQWNVSGTNGQKYLLEVFTMDSRQIHSQQFVGDNIIKVNTAHWQPGIYPYRIVSKINVISGKLQVQ